MPKITKNRLSPRKIERMLRAPLGLLFILIYLFVLRTVTTQATATLPTESAPCVFVSNESKDDLKATMTQAILSAKKSITLIIYSLTDKDIISSLKQKADEGISVCIIHDAVATQDIAFKLGPTVRIRPRHEKGLMHDKILCIDHEEVWLGSANMTHDSLCVHANLMIGIKSKELASVVEKKAQEMLAHTSYKALPATLKSNDQCIELFFFPDSQKGAEKIQQLLQTAKKTIKVAMYTFTHPLLSQELIHAHNRGIQVQVVLDAESSRTTSKKVYLQLLRAHVPVYISDRKGLLHHKLLIVDDKILATGSANWTKAAFQYNDDCLIVISDLTEEQKAKLELLWKTTMNETATPFPKKKSHPLPRGE